MLRLITRRNARAPGANSTAGRRARPLVSWLQYLLPVAVLILGLALRAWDPVMVGDLRVRIFDYFQELKPRAYQALPVRIVDLDDESFARHGQWPWPRIVLAGLLDRLSEAGAAVVVFDIVFSEPDRTSPDQIFELWPDELVDQALRARASALKSHDRLFAESIGRAGNVVLGFALRPDGGGPPPLSRTGYAYTGHDPRLFVPRFKGSVVNLSEIAEAAAGSGSMNLVPERDGIVRRVPLLVNFNDKIYPAMPLEALRIAQGASTLLVKSSGASGEPSFGEKTGIVGVRIGRLTVPTDSAGRTWLYQTREQAVRFVPAWRIMARQFDRAKIEGSIVFIGTSAAGFADLRATPLHPALPGVAIHAQIAEQLILVSYLTRPDWADGAEMIFLALVGALLVLVVPRLGAGWSALVAGVSIAGGIGGSWYAFADAATRLLLDPIYPVFVVAIVYVSGSIMSYLRLEQDRRQLRNWFGLYVSRKLVDRLVSRPDEVVLGGEMRDLTVMFIDVRGFTTISEKMTAGELTTFINRFLTAMTAAVLEHDGTISRYTGDGLLAFWNAPVDEPDHARIACRVAPDMGVRLERLNEDLRAEARALNADYKPIRIGIGLNTGDCCVGNIGSDQRFDYSVMGDAVNVATRLEAETKTYGVPIIIGEGTRDAASDFASIEIDFVRVRGRETPVTIFALVGDQALKADERFMEFAALHDAFMAAKREGDRARAIELSERCQDYYPHIAELYRIARREMSQD